MTPEQIALAQQRFAFDQFDPSVEEWDFYVQRFECELEVFGLRCGTTTELARRRLLLSKIGKEHFRLLVNHFKPQAVHEQTYDRLKAAMGINYGRRASVMVERVHFSQRFRHDEESVVQFMNALRGLASHCEFGPSLAERLRDQLVIGINNTMWQQELLRLFPTNDATLQQVEDAVTRLELADVQQMQLQNCARAVNGAAIRRVKEVGIEKNRQYECRQLDPSKECLRCGYSSHRPGQKCAAEGKKCYACGGDNHLAAVCVKSGRAKVNSQKRKRVVNTIGVTTMNDSSYSDSSNTDTGLHRIATVDGFNRRAVVKVELNGHLMEMLYDPGACYSVISEKIWKVLGCPKLHRAPALVAYTKVPVRVLGKAVVEVKFRQRSRRLQVHVVAVEDSSLFGLDWCIAFGLPLPQGVEIHSVNVQERKNLTRDALVKAFLHEFGDVFSKRGGTLIGYQAVVHMNKNAIPKVFKPRLVPFALKQQVEDEISRLVKEDVLEPVDTGSNEIEWASPIVCVVKPSGKVRICGDFKVTINPHVILDRHPLPRFEDMVVKLNGGTLFSVIDLKDAYLQMLVAEPSRKYLVIATHKGYFRFKRLPFGVSFAPALFQKTMEQILTGLDGVAVYIDDIIVTGTDCNEHMERVREVFLRLRQAGVHVHVDKCKFLQESVNYLGHRIDADGVHPTDERIAAIKQMPLPTNVQELRSFLGAVNYYSRFISRLQPLCAPLYDFLKAGSQWSWNRQHTQLFNQLKRQLSSSDTLVHYDENLPIVLSTDACDRGLGAVLSHRFQSGVEKPIAFASRLLTDVERRYSTIDKEALAIVFGITKFAQYLYGRQFTLRTDHKPLERIFGSHRELPKVATNRLTRWALILGTYNYTVEYTPADRNAPADALSRLPIVGVTASPREMQSSGQLMALRLADLPVTRQELQRQSQKDPTLRAVSNYLENGWPRLKREITEQIRPFADKRDELSFEDRILLWQGRVIIPPVLRRQVLEMVHDGHPGICAMKSIARFHVWWPGLDNDIERYVRGCLTCQSHQPVPPEVPLIPWNLQNEPWARIHVDLAGPFMGLHWLVVVDAHSKWMDVIPLRNTSTVSVVKHCRRLFANFGLPRYIVSDNGPQFTSEEFKTFCQMNNIVHIKATPYHPKTNGLAERAVRTFKERMSKSTSSDNVEVALQRFLFSYRNTPHSTTGRCPAELLIGHRLRTKLDMLKPSMQSVADMRTFKYATYHDRKTKPRLFEPGDKVWVSRAGDPSQRQGVVVERTAQNSYRVDCEGTLLRKHADQIRQREPENPLSSQVGTSDEEATEAATVSDNQTTTPQNTEVIDPDQEAKSESSKSEVNGDGYQRWPKRNVKPPRRPYDCYLSDPKQK
uniref:RNA-directed DNA polymerase n=1 Tax=Trichuris muris TaxID=70415 RepID=A0A5S6QM96_TRIMR